MESKARVFAQPLHNLLSFMDRRVVTDNMDAGEMAAMNSSAIWISKLFLLLPCVMAERKDLARVLQIGDLLFGKGLSKDILQDGTAEEDLSFGPEVQGQQWLVRDNSAG